MATEVSCHLPSDLQADLGASHRQETAVNQNTKLVTNENEDRVDCPTPNAKSSDTVFALLTQPVSSESLKEITNIERPAPVAGIAKHKEQPSEPGDQNISNVSSTANPPSTKASLMSAVDKQELERKYELFLQQRRKQEEMKLKARLKESLITDILSFNRLSLDFTQGYFPGEVVEENLDVYNKTGLDLTYKIHVLCNDEVLNELDEYVFSMRKTGSYDYNDKYLVLQSPGVKSTYKIAMKVPNTKGTGCIAGQVVFFSDDCKGKVIIPILSRVILPNLCSERSLSTRNKDEGVLHFLIKNPRRQDLKVVLKNKSEKLVQADFVIMKDNYMAEHFEVMFNPSVVIYQAGSHSTLGLIIRAATGREIPAPPNNIMRCLLVAKIKNCSAKFTFKCEFRFMAEGSNTSNAD